MITNATSRASTPEAALRRLLALPYRGPIALAALLALLAAMPEGGAHAVMTLVCLVGGMLLSVLGLFSGVAGWVLVLAVPVVAAALPAAVPTVRRRLRDLPRPGNSALAGCALAAGALVVGWSVPGQDYGMIGAGALTLGLMPTAWLTWHTVPHADAALAAAPAATSKAGRWRWAAAPLLIAAAAVLIVQDVPHDARFAAARPALTRYAEHALATGSVGRHPGWIAGYRLDDAELVDGGVKFRIGGTGVFGSHGYAYFASGAPTDHATSYTRLSGPWYVWESHEYL